MLGNLIGSFIVGIIGISLRPNIKQALIDSGKFTIKMEKPSLLKAELMLRIIASSPEIMEEIRKVKLTEVYKNEVSKN